MVVQENIPDHDEEALTLPMKGDKKHRLKQRFDVRQKLGQGTYGKVQLALNRETSQEVAIKTIKKSKIESEQDLIRIRREIQIMSSIQHPHIIHIYEVFENKDKIVLVMQFASGGELYDYLSEKKVLSDTDARRIFRQIAAAVYYCHKNKICHRDLKLENILLDEKGNAKIADFGLSNVFDERHLLKTYCGSPLYASPEIVKGVPYYGPEVDCWSMGVLLYTLVYGAMPFDGSNFKKLVTQISEGDYFEPKKKSNASELIHRLLTVNPLKRATIVDICTDYWVNQGYEHSLLQVAEDMANLTPVRLDLLLALAPSSPIPASATDKDQLKEDSESELMKTSVLDKEVEEEDEEDEEEENPDTMANSFAFVRGSQISNLSISTPDLQSALVESDNKKNDDFSLPGISDASEGHCTKRAAEKSFDGSLMHVSSIAHKSKKTRKSDSSKRVESTSTAALSKVPEKKSSKEENTNSSKNNTCSLTSKAESEKFSEPNLNESGISEVPSNINKIENDAGSSQQNDTGGAVQTLSSAEKVEGIAAEKQQSKPMEEKPNLQGKRMGRPPGKIVIPKTFESPQSTPSPKSHSTKSSPTTASTQCSQETKEKVDDKISPEVTEQKLNSPKCSEKSEATDLKGDSSSERVGKVCDTEQISEAKKLIAKGILKKGIAKAKLAERKLSQQSSIEKDVPTPPVKPPENLPSFFKTPKPYIKQEDQKVKSEAEIVLSSAKSNDTNKTAEISIPQSAPLWDSAVDNQHLTQDQNRNMSWGTISSTLDSEMSNWREQMEESLRRLSPDGSTEKSISPINNSGKSEDDKPLVPIARSYKKFTFTKDGACITETKKIYTTPGADGSWTKVEKKTKITTRPGNAEEFERFRDLHLRNDSPLTKSDSQSSSGSNDMYDDIFDSWTGDTMMYNMVKIRNMFQKFSRDPFLRSDRRRNPFRNFHRTQSDRSERGSRRPELRSGHSTEKESSDNDDEDYAISFDGSNPVVYGPQGLWQFLKSPKKRLSRRVMISQPEHTTFSRSVSQDRSGSKMCNWKHCESRASSGYNTNSRSQSRDRTQSPHEKVLRFVFESPSQEYDCSNKNRRESWGFKSNNSRRDSGVNSDGYESEHSYRRVPSDDFSKSGRVSPVLSAYSPGRQEMMREFVKAWPKEVLSHHNVINEAADNRRHKVEQWLHTSDMNNENFPFDFYGEPHSRIASTRKTSMHDNLSSAYATMRPREYMKYNRSSSDKIAGSNMDFFPFEDVSLSRNMPRTQSKEQDMFKSRTRSFTHSPVSEDSSKEAHSLRNSESSHSNTSVHHINFTISDGRVTSGQTTSPHSTVRHTLLGGLDDEKRTSDNSGKHSYIEQVPVKNTGQPIVQMRVSFNRGNRENKVLHFTSQSPPSSIGLWQHQDQLNTPKSSNSSGNNSLRETSPIPGIKKFSTEMVHTVGNATECQGPAENSRRTYHSGPASIECEVKTTVKSCTGNSQKGKSCVCFPHSVCSDAPSDACLEPCMENAKMTNINLHTHYSRIPNCNIPRTVSNDALFSSKFDAKEANTPDSLEDSNFDLGIQAQDKIDSKYSVNSPKLTPLDNLQLEIKPVGVLWNNYEISNLHKIKHSASTEIHSETWNVSSLNEPYNSKFSSRAASSNDILCDTNKKTQRFYGSPFTEVGSIWEQKNNNCQTFDLIKELLSDDDLDNIIPEHSVCKSNDGQPFGNKSSQAGTKEARMLKIPPLSVLDTISVIEGYQLDESAEPDFSAIVPSLMDDLQSPRKVLHQALRIGKSLKTCE